MDRARPRGPAGSPEWRAGIRRLARDSDEVAATRNVGRRAHLLSTWDAMPKEIMRTRGGCEVWSFGKLKSFIRALVLVG